MRTFDVLALGIIHFLVNAAIVVVTLCCRAFAVCYI